jgi:hypothetical protein
MRIHRVADRAVGKPACFFYESDRRLHVVDIVERVEYAHDIDTASPGILAETFDA